MTKRIDLVQPKDERGNDANDFRDDPEYLGKLQPVGGEQEQGSGLVSVDLTDLATAEIEPPKFVIEPIIPRGFVSLFGGHGGSGKSILSLAWSAHVACGMNWGKLRVERSRVVFVSLEDPPSVVRFRLRRVCQEYLLPMWQVVENLEVIDATEIDALAVETNTHGVRSLVYTPAAEEIREKAASAGLVVIDNASDAFDANENERRLVRAFVRYLQRAVRDHDGAVLLLAHIDKVAARHGSGGNSYSGSTAWHNSTRSRLAMINDELVHEKLNVGKKLDDPIPLAWSDAGVLVPDLEGEAKKASEAEQHEADAAAVLAAMQAATEAGELVSAASRGSVIAWHTLRQFPELPEALKNKTGKTRTQEAILQLIRAGNLRRVDYVDQYRHKREKLEIVSDE